MSAPLYLYLAVQPPNGASAVVCAPSPEGVAPYVWFGAQEYEVFTLGLAAPDMPLGWAGYLQLPPADLLRTLRDAEARAGQGCGAIPRASLYRLIQANAELGLAHTDLLVAAQAQASQLAALRSLVERAKETGTDDGWRKEARVVLRESRHETRDTRHETDEGQGPGVSQ